MLLIVSKIIAQERSSEAQGLLLEVLRALRKRQGRAGGGLGKRGEVERLARVGYPWEEPREGRVSKGLGARQEVREGAQRSLVKGRGPGRKRRLRIRLTCHHCPPHPRIPTSRAKNVRTPSKRLSGAPELLPEIMSSCCYRREASRNPRRGPSTRQQVGPEGESGRPYLSQTRPRGREREGLDSPARSQLQLAQAGQ